MILTPDEIRAMRSENAPFWQLVQEVADEFGVEVADIKGHSKKAHIVKARDFACYFAHKRGLPLARIGWLLDRRDHTTIMYAVQKVAKKLAEKGETP